MKTIFTLTLLIAVIMIFGSADLLAQPALPSGPSQAPIDGGLSLLAAGGAAYAMKKLRDKRKAE